MFGQLNPSWLIFRAGHLVTAQLSLVRSPLTSVPAPFGGCARASQEIQPIKSFMVNFHLGLPVRTSGRNIPHWASLPRCHP